MKTYAIVAAGGSGSRFGGSIPKQYMKLCGIPVIMYSVMAFQKNEKIDGIIISADEKYHEDILSMCREYGIDKLKKITVNGNERRDSVYKALDAAEGLCDIVLIHDAARPLLPQSVINDAVINAVEYGAVATVVPSADTILVSEDGKFLDYTPDRKTLYAMQTPQSFRLSEILKAHREIPSDAVVTDDCSMIRFTGGKVKLIEGSGTLLKLTRQSDFTMLEVFAEKYLEDLKNE